MNNDYLLVARCTGLIMQISMPACLLEHQYLQLTDIENPSDFLSNRIVDIYLNYTATKLMMIDITGMAQLLQLEARPIPGQDKVRKYSNFIFNY
jgi:hypothetical protein